MRTVFIAEDGTSFDRIDECQAYERQHDKVVNLLKSITGYTHKGDVITSNEENAYDTLENLYQNADFIKNSRNWTDEEINLVNNNGVDNLPCKEGIYRWLSDRQNWVTYEEELQNLNNTWAPIRRA